MNISVVIPLLNEKESLRELTDSLMDVMKSYKFSYEIFLYHNPKNYFFRLFSMLFGIRFNIYFFSFFWSKFIFKNV